MKVSSQLVELVTRGAEDWVSPGEIFDDTGANETPASDVHQAVGLVCEAVFGGYVEAGELDAQGFVPWPCNPAEAVRRIASQWLFDDPVPVQDVGLWWCAFRNTEKGDALAREHA